MSRDDAPMSDRPEYFLSCDWGTTHFRLRLVVTETLQVMAEHRDRQGVKALAAAEGAGRAQRFATHLRDGVAKLANAAPKDARNSPVIVSGMASSSLGWMELPYASAPVPLDGSGLVVKAEGLDGRRVLLVSGVCTDMDVMRGEEVELVGLRALLSDPALWVNTCVVLPGTHAKHVLVRGGMLTRFHTHMTGELLACLTEASVLKHSVEPAEWDESFREPLIQGSTWGATHGVGGGIFSVRVRELFRRGDARSNYWYLCGVLLGAELAQLPVEPDVRVLLAARGQFAATYGAVVAAREPHRPRPVIPTEEIMQQSLLAGHRAVLLAHWNTAGLQTATAILP